MAYLKKSQVKQFAQNYRARRSYASAHSLATESERLHSVEKRYDIFLSHSVKDAELVLGVKAWLEDQGNAVYVDWIDDPEVDRSRVTPANAQLLRSRMAACSSMIFIATDNASGSKWMPWELGYFDGMKENRIAILPVLEDWQSSFEGQEYLGLYPVIEQSSSAYATRNIVRGKNNIELGHFTKGYPVYL